MKFYHYIIIAVLLMAGLQGVSARDKYNFNMDWLFQLGDLQNGQSIKLNDTRWKAVNLPHTFNEDEAFKVKIWYMTDTIAWYRKHFRLPREAAAGKVFIEFEGARQAAEVWINGHHVGLSENGVMAFGFDLTPYINEKGDNLLAVRIDNSWNYKERATGQGYQWNDKNFNANYGGLPKNVWLHITEKVYQTLPLYSNLGTTGVYVYAKDIDVKHRKATICTESQVKNESKKVQTLSYSVDIIDAEGKTVSTFSGESKTLRPGGTTIFKAEKEVSDLHFWSYGYGYLYKVKTIVSSSKGNHNTQRDVVTTTTGFRKTRFGDGMVWLNDRVIQLKGYAQRSSNEWPGVGSAYPAWLADYSNRVLVEGNGNLYRWMHVTPNKQDIESCDRYGVIQMMPAGDAEKDVRGRRWGQRTELMRDAIIYNRNNPSILFYESGNESISREHMKEMRAIRDEYDPNGGRAIGSREMLDVPEAEYGGEMLYVNKSANKPFVQTEYCRDEGYRMYWDDESYPFHKEGDGPAVEGLAKGKVVKRDMPRQNYNRNQDEFAKELVARWNELFQERAGTGRRVNSGGAKIVFSETQTYGRSELNYRVSGVVDAMRIPKDAYYAHKVMWEGWVDNEKDGIYICGHNNYNKGVTKTVYVVSTADKVELFLNGTSKGLGKRSDHFLFTFPDIKMEDGKVEAIGYKDGKEVCRTEKHTVGNPAALKLTLISNPAGTKADGNDVALVQVEVVDDKGERCPLANDMVEFSLNGPAEWRGGIAKAADNYALSKKLPVEAGVNRVMVRATREAGIVKLTAKADGLSEQTISFQTTAVDCKEGLSSYIPGETQPSYYGKGAVKSTPSYTQKNIALAVDSITAGSNQADACKSIDDNEMTEWASTGNDAWITYRLARRALIDDVCLKLTGWRKKSYPVEILEGDSVVWRGETPKSLGYIHLFIDHPVMSDRITIRLTGTASDQDAFGAIVEVEDQNAGTLDMVDKGGKQLRIIEAEFRERLIKE